MKNLLVLLLLLKVNMCWAQLFYSLDDDTQYIVNVEKELEAAGTDSAKGYLHFKLSILYKLLNDTSKIKYHLDRGLILKSKHPFLDAVSYFYIANSLYPKKDIKAIEYHLLKADAMLKKFNHAESYKMRAYVWHNYGTWQQIKGSEKGAMKAFINQALPCAIRSKDEFIIGNINKAIAIVLMNANQRKKASLYLQQAIIKIKKSPKNNPVRLENLAESYITAAENYLYDDLPKKAKPLLVNAKEIISIQPSSNLFLNYYYAEGVYFDKVKAYKKSKQSFNLGIALAHKTQTQFWENRLMYAKYKMLKNAGDFKSSSTVLTNLIGKPGIFDTDKKIYYKDLYVLSEYAKNYNQAFKWAKKYIALSDSLYDAKFQNDILELENKYNASEKEKQISMLKAEKQSNALKVKNDKLVILLLIIGIIFSTLLSFMGFKLSKNSKKLALQKETSFRQQLNKIKQEQQLQLAEALLQGEDKERKRLAVDLHDGLGGMLSAIKMNLVNVHALNTDEELTKIVKQLDYAVYELRRIAHNMMPETLLNSGIELALKDLCESLLSDKLKIDLQVLNLENNISQKIQITIYRIIQELLTNAIKHAEATYILVQCSQNNNNFYITVEDNGLGFEQGESCRNGMGLANVKNRVDYLQGEMEVISALNEGTTINIEFNVSG